MNIFFNEIFIKRRETPKLVPKNELF